MALEGGKIFPERMIKGTLKVLIGVGFDRNLFTRFDSRATWASIK